MPIRNQVGDPVGHGAGFTASRARKDEEGAVSMEDCRFLTFVEFGEIELCHVPLGVIDPLGFCQEVGITLFMMHIVNQKEKAEAFARVEARLRSSFYD
jgi:hypothetical protein